MYSAADIPVNWDDPFCVGNQAGGGFDMAWWCPECWTHTSWSWVWFTPWSRWQFPICWWCNGPQQAEKPTRTMQRVDGSIRETRLEMEAREEEHWWTFDVREYAIPFTD